MRIVRDEFHVYVGREIALRIRIISLNFINVRYKINL